MNIISLNAWGGQVWSALGSWIGRCGGDVVCLQEVIRPSGPSPLGLPVAAPTAV
jgi:hypothetical protein